MGTKALHRDVDLGKDTASCGSECESPPSVPRGWNSQTGDCAYSVACHWLRVSVDKADVKSVSEYLEHFFGTDNETQQYGLWFFDRSTYWPGPGVRLNYHSQEHRYDITKGMASVEIPGNALEDLGFVGACYLVRGLKQIYDVRCTRFDAAYDDYQRVITPDVLLGIIIDRERVDGVMRVTRRDFTGFRKCGAKWAISGEDPKIDEVYFGARGSAGSGKYLRVYDKKIETNGQINAVRWELELCDERANKAFEMMANLGADPGAVAANLGALIGGCIDFRKRTTRAGDKNLDRLERYEFWSTILEALGKVDKETLKLERVPKSVERAKDHIWTQCIGNLQLLRNAYGADVLFGKLIAAVMEDDRMGNQHHAALKDYQRKIEGRDRLDIRDIRQYFDEHGIECHEMPKL